MKTIRPQDGPQTAFLQSSADIAFYGGAAGGGKSFALLLDPLYHWNNPRFQAVIFRRNTTQIRNPGGLWDESVELYAPLGAKPREASLEWQFHRGMHMKLAHLEHEKTVLEWQGSQLSWLGFDELTHFTAKQFWYMLSRLRSMAGVPGRVRATMNPDVDHWVRRFIDWWIGPDGYPILERSGVLRWFVRINDEIIWGDSREELVAKYGEESLPKSFTFIPAKLQDNRILMEKDPTYAANLRALPRIDRLRLEGGNWNVRAEAGMYFRREWFGVLDAIPAGWIRAVRYWDRAATEPSEANPDPDYTVGLKMYQYPNNTYLIVDIRRGQLSSLKVESLIRNTASADGPEVEQVGEQEPGAGGKADADNFIRLLSGYVVDVERSTTAKDVRAKPVSAQCEAGNVSVLRAPWNEAFFAEVENFTGRDSGGHDDQVDCLAGAFNRLASAQRSILDAF